MLITKNEMLSSFLEHVAESLDIPPWKYKQAVERYNSVGEHLVGQGSLLAKYTPDIYTQGSFALGTVVRPIRQGQEADYDIDLVCELKARKDSITSARVKGDVGDRLKEYRNHERLLDEEGRRCWTLNYAEEDGIGFHLDCLPCIPDDDLQLRQYLALGIPGAYFQCAVAVTDLDKGTGVYSWSPSNPRGYAKWFKDINISSTVLIERAQRKRLFEANQSLYSSVDEVPEALIRTSLQRAIQILKRHRDTRFVGHKWEKQQPISMIITTLAARAYDGNPDLGMAISHIVDEMIDYVRNGLIQKVNGMWVIPNPVNPAENFADRWNEPGSERAQAFFQWLQWVKEDIHSAQNLDDLDDLSEALSSHFGKRAVAAAAAMSRSDSPMAAPFVKTSIKERVRPWSPQ